MAARDPAWTRYAALLFASLAYVVASLAAWVFAVRRRARVAGSLARTHASRSKGIDLIPVPLSLLGQNSVTASASQQLRYVFFRMPKATQSILIVLAMALVLGHTSVQSSGLMMGAALMAPLLAVVTSFNLFAFDGQGLVYLNASGARMRPVLTGKVVAGLLISGSATTIFILAEATLHRDWVSLLPAVLATLGLLALGAGVGAVASVLAPYDRVARGRGRTKYAAYALGGIVIVFAAVALGSVSWLAATDAGVPSTIAALVLLAAGGAVGAALTSFAGRLLASRPDRLVIDAGLS